MSRLTIPTRDAAPAATQPLLDAVEKQLGVVPNMFRLLAQSPAVLQGYLGLNGALGKALDLKTRERIAVAVAQVNGCDYCLSAHSYVGLNLAKVPADEIARARQGSSADPKTEAALRFAVKVTEARGKVASADLAAIRAAGFSEAQILEIVAVVAENFMTNLFNNVAETDIDFPAVHAADAA
jgi:uncharacterized peroxidase-related enzyme